MTARGLLPLLMWLAACAPPPPEVPQRRVVETGPVPPMKSFGAAAAAPPQRSNAAMAQDFLDLNFRLESGRRVERLTRFEQPVTVTMTGAVPPSAQPDLALLLERFRREAGIDIRALPRGPGAITIEFLPRARLQALVPDAACYVVPRVSSFAEYRGVRRSPRVDWTTLEVRERVAVFIPSDTAPQEVRDCLHEELAQALGPLNDLYRLSDSVYNDDNFHAVLTGFDMLMLRVHYDRDLQDGMTQPEVASRLPAILARLNPGGERPGPAVPDATPRAWIEAIETALGPRRAYGERRRAAVAAVALARAEGWDDARLAFSLFALGRLTLADDPGLSVAALTEAGRIYRRLPGGAIHAAHIDMQMAAYALSGGDAAAAITLADRAMPVATAAENAALLASLMMIKAQALDQQGRGAAAAALRLDSLGWARYGFGGDDAVQARLYDIAILTRAPGGG
jgi:hypothetical protein